ncbi:MAG: primosomal protein N' [Desulfovibrio sp.]|nr:MAG: primosomal protein N' [Desulfovibrio sp.]
MPSIWHAAVLSPPYSTLSYLAPPCFGGQGLRPGQRVVVPLGNSVRMAILLAEASPNDAPQGVELKELLWPVDRHPLLSQEYLEMVEHLAARQMAEPGRILGGLLPGGLRIASLDYMVYGDARPKAIKPRALAAMDWKEKELLARAWQEGRMEVKQRIKRLAREYVHVAHDPPWPVRPSAKRQIAVLEHVWDKGVAELGALRGALGPEAVQVAKLLADRGLLRITPEPPEWWGGNACQDQVCVTEDANQRPALTPEQETALSGLRKALHGGADKPWLLHGVTGSGKTRLYLELALECLRAGRSAYLLAPEVALACKLRQEARVFFAAAPDGFSLPEERIVLSHGYLPPTEREEIFLKLARAKEPMLITGTRSALFTPAPAPGLFVLDEEHDASFKQDERLTYQAKEVAYFLARQSSGLLVLGSATPDVKTHHAAEFHHIERAMLNTRVGSGTLPEVELLNICGLNPTEHLLAPQAQALLKTTVDAGDQAVIMLNRRGYSPLMYCLDCGQTLKCGDCDIGLTYHKGRERLVCHYCGQGHPFPMICPGCGGSSYLPMGEGTEKLEEALAHLLPSEAGVLRLDRDSARRPGRMEDILGAFAQGKSQVLVGTQMLSKGHHFPNVTLVIAADGDLGLNLPDYRAAERTFQLLVQVSGRAGRGEKPGRVCIQTRDPKHPCWEFIKNHDYLGFAAKELELRKARSYPPYSKLGLIRMSFPKDFSPGMSLVTGLAHTVREQGKRLGVLALGPAPAPLGLLRGRKRFHCLLKAEAWPPIRELYHHAQTAIPAKGEVRIALDLDPVDML